VAEAKGEINVATLQALASVLFQRDQLASRLGKQFNSVRRLYEVLGYKYKLTFLDYLAKYDRQDIATRVVDAPVSTSWRRAPTVREDRDNDTQTEFEEAWEQLIKDRSVYRYLQRVDILSGIGRYGILLIGVRGGTPLDQPLEDGSLAGPEDIIYLKPYMEGSASIVDWEVDPSNERFGEPLMYEINLTSDLVAVPKGKTVISKTHVHYSRVLHIAEGLLENEVFGTPRLKGVFNRLDDLEKVAGGSAEMFWQGAYGGLHADVRQGYKLENPTALSDEIEEYVHGLRRFIRTEGIEIQRLQAQLGDPKSSFDILIALISCLTQIPVRILLGSERGELASTTDQDSWFGYIKERQTNYVEPAILRRFIDWCMTKGVLPLVEKYEVEWPALYEMSDKDKAEIGLKKSQAIKEYSPPGATDIIVPPGEFREKILGLDAEPDEKYQDNSIETELDEKNEEAKKQFEESKKQPTIIGKAVGGVKKLLGRAG